MSALSADRVIRAAYAGDLGREVPVLFCRDKFLFSAYCQLAFAEAIFGVAGQVP